MPRNPRKAQNPDNELGEQVAEKIAQQHRDLTLRNWPAIKNVMDNDEGGEAKVSFATVLTNRPAEDGAQASKDRRIVTTISFSLGKQTDKIESDFPVADQMELGEKKGETE